MLDSKDLKEYAADYAIKLIMEKIKPSDILGIGTGSTVDIFIEKLAKYKNIIYGVVASSVRTSNKLEGLEFNILDLNTISNIAFYIDGADEIDNHLNMIKGGGGALTREKIVASVSDQFICIVDESKLVDKLGKFPLPIEVLNIAKESVSRKLDKIGGKSILRHNFITDNSNIILDVHGLDFSRCTDLENFINNIPGVVTCGLFSSIKAHKAIVATQNGIRIMNSSL